jgi:glycosyltransferase involved in cell wall biosynthesis
VNFFAEYNARFNRYLSQFLSNHFFGIYFLLKNNPKSSLYSQFFLQAPAQAFITNTNFTQRYGYTGGYADQRAITRPLRVMMLGLRGFPDVQGGIETHAEHLAPLLVNLGCDLEVVVRSHCQKPSTGKVWCGVKFTQLWSPKSKAFEAIVHTFFGVLYAAIKRPDILHIHAVGPALMTPIARLLGLRVVVTHHGQDYNRQKWGYVARHVLLLGEWFGMRFSHARIVISDVIRDTVARKHAVQAELIHNGVVLPNLDVSADYLSQFGLQKNRYILLVSRLVPEKRHLDLIEAFNQANLNGYKLALVGYSDHPDGYVQALQDAAKANSNIVLTGFQKGDTLRSLYTHAALFVLPSSHEGLSISLLEALSYGLPVIASDIPANIEVGLKPNAYFELGNIKQLKEMLCQQTTQNILPENKMHVRAWINSHYNWKNIAEKTVTAYHSAF